MESKKINQLATSVSPQTSDLTIIGDPITGVSKKITLLQIANLFATTGTVSSVAVTETGDALTITGSPITSTGTINIGFAGNATQYVRGDGALADFPTSTGGGSSVSYYLNSSVSQGTIGGVAYRQLSKTPISGAGTDITISANGYVASYITDANDPALLEVPGGNFNCEFYFSVNSNAHNPYVYAELYKYNGSTFTLLGSSQSVPEYLSNGTTLSPYYFAIPVATAALTVTDRLAVRIFVNVDTRVVTLHTENNHLCQIVTTFSKGLISLNNLTRQNQFFGTGTSGTDFAITSSTATHTFNLPVASATNTGKLSSTDWSTFNGKVPYTGAIASVNLGIYDLDAANLFSNGSGVYIKKNVSGIANTVGYVALSSSTYKLNVAEASSGSNAKAFNFDFSTLTDTTLSVNNTRTYTLPDLSGTLALTSQLTGGTVTSIGLSSATSGVTIGSSPITTSGTITLAIATASGSQNGLLSSTDWTTFNNKYNLPSLTSGSVLFSNGTTIAQNNANFFWDNTNSFLGVGTNVPSAGITSFSSTPAFQFKAAGAAPAMTFSNTLTAATYAAVFGLATSNNQFITGTATGDFAIANQSTSAGAIVFGTGTTEKMRMTSAGTFSIGNTNSTFNLDVTGTGRFTGSVTSDDLILTAGTLFGTGNTGFSNRSSDSILYLQMPTNGFNITDNSLNNKFTLSSAGAGVFSSTLIANNNISAIRSGSSLTTLGQSRYLNLNDYFGNSNARMEIGFGYSAATGVTNVPAIIGFLQTAATDLTKGDLYFATRDVTTDTAPTVRLTIASTGAATFSSSVGIGNSADSSQKLVVNQGATAFNQGIPATSGTTQNGIFRLRPSTSLYGETFDFGMNVSASPYAWIQSTNAGGLNVNYPLILNPNGGNVGIGTSIPPYKLSVNANAVGVLANISDGIAETLQISTGSGYVSFLNPNSGVIAFRDSTNTTERLRITSGGNVGIGTSSPNARLDLGSSYGANGEKFLIYNDSSTSALTGTKMGFYIDRFGESNSITFVFPYAAGTNSRYHVAYKDTSGTTITDVCYVTHNSTSWSFPSDERLKDIESIIPNALDKIKDLRAVYYTQKRDPEKKRKVGLLAQDLLKVLPEVVDLPDTELDENGNQKYMSVALSDTIPLLVKAIQEQQAQIEELKQKYYLCKN